MSSRVARTGVEGLAVIGARRCRQSGWPPTGSDVRQHLWPRTWPCRPRPRGARRARDRRRRSSAAGWPRTRQFVSFASLQLRSVGSAFGGENGASVGEGALTVGQRPTTRGEEFGGTDQCGVPARGVEVASGFVAVAVIHECAGVEVVALLSLPF